MAEKQIREWAYELLVSAATAKSARDVAEELVRAGYRPRKTKSPDQLRRSVWVALTRDPRVRNVGRGLFAPVTTKP